MSRLSRLATSGVFWGAVTPRSRQHQYARDGLALAHLSVPFVRSSANSRGAEARGGPSWPRGIGRKRTERTRGQERDWQCVAPEARPRRPPLGLCGFSPSAQLCHESPDGGGKRKPVASGNLWAVRPPACGGHGLGESQACRGQGPRPVGPYREVSFDPALMLAIFIQVHLRHVSARWHKGGGGGGLEPRPSPLCGRSATTTGSGASLEAK